MIAMLTMLASAHADPCGMVPPIWTGSGPEPAGIERQGLQQTYVFHRDGVETIAIRPGFTGSVEQFGMLIPLPAVPALRKIDDRTFDHLRSAVDPPQVRVHVQERNWLRSSAVRESVASAPESEDDAGLKLRRDQVVVVKEEAVGMYEVAVLEAGSPRALSRWMDQNQFRYPDGMDDTVEQYVQARWLFVAVKARVGAMSGVEPRPGMTRVDDALPRDAAFDGYVQGMAFRFAADRPVVPMRLAVFNGDDTHNRVYMLSDEALRIREVSANLVRRQVAGRTLYDNVTKPLPVVMGTGTMSTRIREEPQVQNARNPEPHVQAARALMASDLISARTGALSLAFEEQEKELLRINEALGLRGVHIDNLVASEVAEVRDRALAPALSELYEMTLTVVDGVFPFDVLRDRNLTFAGYRMPASRNRLEVWNDRKPPIDVWVYR